MSEYNWTALAASFADGVVKTRKGPDNTMLDYIDARDVMDRLDAVVGPANWQDEYMPGPEGGVLCKLSILVNGQWVTKCDVGEKTDIEAVKGGCSDAFKRAAVKWGIGRFLYQEKQPGKKTTKDPKAKGTSPTKADGVPISERPDLIKRVASSWFGGNQANALAYMKQLYETKVDDFRLIHAGMDDVTIWRVVGQHVWPESLVGQMMLQGLAEHPNHAYNRLAKMCEAGRIDITDPVESILAEVANYQAEKTHQDR